MKFAGVLVFTVFWFTFAYTPIGLRVNEDAEREGLDISSHGEAAYEN